MRDQLYGGVMGSWKVLPHPDHKASEVITRKMTPEEIEKYGPKSNIENKKRGLYNWKTKEGNKMKTKYPNEVLIPLFKKFGSDKEGRSKIAEKLGIDEKQVEKLYHNRGIKHLLDKVHPATEEKIDEPEMKSIDTVIEEMKGIIAESELIDKGELIRHDDGYLMANNPAERERRGLKPKALISQEVNGLEYALRQEIQIKQNNNRYILVDWEDLDGLIADLQELKKYA